MTLRTLTRSIKDLARLYRDLTGKPLGVVREVGEFEAARILGVQLAPPRTPGYDATQRVGGRVQRLQVKTRLVRDGTKAGQVGNIRFDHAWDFVVLVLLDDTFEPTRIYQASRAVVKKALHAPGSRARNERGSLSGSKFKAIGQLLWKENAR